MTRLEISFNIAENYAKQYAEFNGLTDEDKRHVVNGLLSIVNWYNKQEELGDKTPAHGFLGSFLEGVVKNDFIKAVTNADPVNFRCLAVYARFIFNIMPKDYREKAKLL